MAQGFGREGSDSRDSKGHPKEVTSERQPAEGGRVAGARVGEESVAPALPLRAEFPAKPDSWPGFYVWDYSIR